MLVLLAMDFVVLTTVQDEGAAQIAKDAVAELGIPVRVQRRSMNPYFAILTHDTFEIRVPAERLAEAQQALAWLERDARLALDGSPGEPGTAPAAGPAPRKMSFAVALGCLLPFPASCFYARRFGLGWLLCGLFAGALLWGSLDPHHRADAFGLGVAIKAADALLAPLLIAVERRRERPALRRDLLLALLTVVCLFGLFVSLVVDGQREAQRQRKAAPWQQPRGERKEP